MRDRRNLLILLGQVPLLALAIVGLFKAEVFAARRRSPARPSSSCSSSSTTAIWLGSIDAAREIIKEKQRLRPRGARSACA